MREVDCPAGEHVMPRSVLTAVIVAIGNQRVGGYLYRNWRDQRVC